MKYKESGFRALYKHLSVFMLNDVLHKMIADYPDADEADCVLTYGYIDHEAGLTLEILAAGIEEDDCFMFADGNDTVRSFVRIEAVEDEEFFLLEDPNGTLMKRYASKIEALRAYDVDEEIEKTRDMEFLDGFRDAHCIDDVLVCLMKDGLKPEKCWARISGLGDHWFMGTLLNEPYQDFGYHKGERIAFFIRKTEEGAYFCYTDMTPDRKLTAEDLEDGSMLKEAIRILNEQRTEPHFIDVMEFLRDSYVWIPCIAIPGERDRALLQKAVEEAGDSPDSLVGKTFTSQDEVRMVPDILQDDDKYYFPVFTSCEEMGDYGEAFSKLQCHFLKVIRLALNNEMNVSGIVVNAFSDPFVLDRGLFDLVEGMKSRIE